MPSKKRSICSIERDFGEPLCVAPNSLVPPQINSARWRAKMWFWQAGTTAFPVSFSDIAQKSESDCECFASRPKHAPHARYWATRAVACFVGVVLVSRGYATEYVDDGIAGIRGRWKRVISRKKRKPTSLESCVICPALIGCVCRQPIRDDVSNESGCGGGGQKVPKEG